MKTQLPPEAIAAWDRGEKIEAIRLVREHTGLGLAESMQALDSGAYAVSSTQRFANPQVPPAAAAAAARGDLIEAIKLTRQATGLGLKEAKALVERTLGAEADTPPSSPQRSTKARLAPGEVPRGPSSAVVIAILLALAAGAAIFYLRG
jgi:ribosomal protein L7/L12